MSRGKLWILLAFILVAGCRNEGREENRLEDDLFNRLAGEHFLAWTRFYPVEATSKGHHDHDGELGDYTPVSIRERLSWLQNFRQRLLGVDATTVSRPVFVDLLVLTNAVKAEIEELGGIEAWKHSPLFYSGIIHSGILCLWQSEIPSETELQSLVSRIAKIPAVLEAARSNIDEPPRLHVEEAVSELTRSRVLIESLLASLGNGPHRRNLAELGARSRDAIRSLASFTSYLQSRALPKATSEFALGEEKLGRILRYQELVDQPFESLQENLRLDISATEGQILELVSRLEGSPSPEVAFARVASEYPETSEVLPFVERIAEEIQSFAVERRLLTPLMDEPVQLLDMPVHLRTAGQMSLVAPGPLEPRTVPSIFFLSLPGTDWSRAQTEARLRLLNHRTLRLAVIREIYPGKSLLDSIRSSELSRIRKLHTSRAHRDGWGLYVEQMLLESGYEWDDPYLRLAHLQNSLLELSRAAAAIELHTGVMTLSEAVQLFRRAHLDPARARREARAVAVDPTRWSAALGRLFIMELRNRYLEEDPNRTLQMFHDGLLATYGLPLPLVERLFLASGVEDSPD
jgi:uncharacterized protein (DUF885 family)